MKHLLYFIVCVCALTSLSARKMDDTEFQSNQESTCCDSSGVVAKNDGQVEKNKYARSSGCVFVTNERDEEISVEWEVSLSKSMKSSGRGRVDPDIKKMKMRENINWMVDRDESKMAPVYTVTVRASCEGFSHKLIGQKTKEVTMSECDLFGDDQKDSLYICVGKDDSIDIAVGRAK